MSVSEERILLAGLACVFSEEYDVCRSAPEELVNFSNPLIPKDKVDLDYWQNLREDYKKMSITIDELKRFLASKNLPMEDFPWNVKDCRKFTEEIIEFKKNESKN